MAKELLSPVALVELGRRISKKRADGLGLVGLIEDARVAVEQGLKILVAAAKPLDITERQLKDLIFRAPSYHAFKWAEQDPPAYPRSHGGHRFPPAGTVLTGKKDRAGSGRRYAFVFREGAAILLFENNTRYAHGSLSSLAQAANYHGSAKQYWSPLGRYEPGARLIRGA